jgi:hypothetical protein
VLLTSTRTAGIWFSVGHARQSDSTVNTLTHYFTTRDYHARALTAFDALGALPDSLVTRAAMDKL